MAARNFCHKHKLNELAVKIVEGKIIEAKKKEEERLKERVYKEKYLSKDNKSKENENVGRKYTPVRDKSENSRSLAKKSQ